MTDFTDQRLTTWSRTLDPKKYELRERGETWAVARESSPGSPFWVVARYDWSDPAVIRWTVADSSYGGGGQGSVQITLSHDGGSRLHVQWDATDARTLQKPLLFAPPFRSLRPPHRPVMGHGPRPVRGSQPQLIPSPFRSLPEPSSTGRR